MCVCVLAASTHIARLLYLRVKRKKAREITSAPLLCVIFSLYHAAMSRRNKRSDTRVCGREKKRKWKRGSEDWKKGGLVVEAWISWREKLACITRAHDPIGAQESCVARLSLAMPLFFALLMPLLHARGKSRFNARFICAETIVLEWWIYLREADALQGYTVVCTYFCFASRLYIFFQDEKGQWRLYFSVTKAFFLLGYIQLIKLWIRSWNWTFYVYVEKTLCCNEHRVEKCWLYIFFYIIL